VSSIKNEVESSRERKTSELQDNDQRTLSPPALILRTQSQPVSSSPSPKKSEIHQPYKDLIPTSTCISSSFQISNSGIPFLPPRYPPIYTAPPPPPPTSFYPPTTTSNNLLSSYFASGLANPNGSLIPPHPVNPLGLSPYMPFPPTPNPSLHSFLAAIEAASAVAQLQHQHHQQQQHLNNNNNQSPEIKRPIPQIAVSPATNQIMKSEVPQVPFPMI
jgi:hypothetical protein